MYHSSRFSQLNCSLFTHNYMIAVTLTIYVHTVLCAIFTTGVHTSSRIYLLHVYTCDMFPCEKLSRNTGLSKTTCINLFWFFISNKILAVWSKDSIIWWYQNIQSDKRIELKSYSFEVCFKDIDA